MLDNIVYKLPKEIELSEYVKERAIAYCKIMLHGHYFYIPISKKMKKIFKIKIRKGKLSFTDLGLEMQFESMMRLIADGVYLQMRDYVCVGIESSLHQKLQQGFSDLFERYIHKRVKGEITKRISQLK